MTANMEMAGSNPMRASPFPAIVMSHKGERSVDRKEEVARKAERNADDW